MKTLSESGLVRVGESRKNGSCGVDSTVGGRKEMYDNTALTGSNMSFLFTNRILTG